MEAFGLTANNITYALLGETLRYWDFFPAAAPGWGRLPVWGHAEVVAASGLDVAEGSRVFGYLPMGTHLPVTVAHSDPAGFTDRSAHRASLPAACNHYRFVHTDPVRDRDAEDQQMTVWPLFFTSFLLADLLDEHSCFGAARIVLSSASSRTALGLAFLLATFHPDTEVLGLTSASNRPYVTKLGVYDEVLGYDEAGELPGSDAVYVDFADDSSTTRAVHHRYAEQLRASIEVGATHGNRTTQPATALPGPAPWQFFSPDRTRDRARALGLPELLRRIDTAWRTFRPTAERWFPTLHRTGAEPIRRTYLDILHGRTAPGVGHVVSF